MKTCFKCKESKPLSDFYKHKMMADGHLNKCKACAKVDVQENRKARIDYYRAYDVARAKTPKRRKLATVKSREWRAEHKQRYKAHALVARAVSNGALKPSPCEACGTEKHVHAHHDDYSKPLDVKWLCPVHHAERHKELRQ